MKYRIIILIIIIISLGQILLSYIANTSHMQACACTRTHAVGRLTQKTRVMISVHSGSMSCTASFIIYVTSKSKTKTKCHCQQRKKTHFQKCA